MKLIQWRFQRQQLKQLLSNLNFWNFSERVFLNEYPFFFIYISFKRKKMVEHTIDLQSLEIKPQSPNYSYIGLDENNELVRTTIDGASSGGGDVDLTGYATEQWVKQQGYVTDSDVNDYVGNEIEQIEETFNNYYTKTEVDDKIDSIEIPEGGTSDPDSYIIYLPETYIEEVYSMDTWEAIDSVWYEYEGSEMMEHNRKVIQAINEGKVKSVYLQRIREYFTTYDWENNTFSNKPIFMYIPIQFRPKNEIVDSYTRIYGYYALSEDDNNQIYITGYNFNDNGSAFNTIDRPYEIENNGGSGGGSYDSNPTFDSITVNGGAYFNSEIVMAGGGQDGESDIASGIACAFKAGKTQSIDQWTRNIHTGTDGQGLRVCSSDEYGETQYMAVDTDCNIYEGTTKLSDKYATKAEIGDINNILSSI